MRSFQQYGHFFPNTKTLAKVQLNVDPLPQMLREQLDLGPLVLLAPQVQSKERWVEVSVARRAPACLLACLLGLDARLPNPIVQTLLVLLKMFSVEGKWSKVQWNGRQHTRTDNRSDGVNDVSFKFLSTRWSRSFMTAVSHEQLRFFLECTYIKKKGAGGAGIKKRTFAKNVIIDVIIEKKAVSFSRFFFQ